MRKLFITRKSSFVGCLQKLKVYISDSVNSELDICDIPCRKIGEIKNDETVTFEIDNDVNRVFVIADKATRNACCDSVHIMAGYTNIELSGKCKFNPARLNSFVFDVEPDEMAKRYRNKANVRGGLVIAGAVMIAGILGVLAYLLPILLG